MKVFTRLAIVALAVSSPISAGAQTQAQQDRLDRVGQFVVISPICEKLGMKVDPDLPKMAEAGLASETSSWPIAAETIERLKQEAVARQGRIFSTDLDAASAGAKTDAQLRGVKDILLGYGRVCMAATVDPIFSSLIAAPAGYNLDGAATTLADTMLERGGLASWQTPQIQARGDLMMLAGTCRAKIGAARSDALTKQYGQSDDPRVRNYYSRSFDEGLADPGMIETLAGCNRAILASRAKAN